MPTLRSSRRRGLAASAWSSASPTSGRAPSSRPEVCASPPRPISLIGRATASRDAIASARSAWWRVLPPTSTPPTVVPVGIVPRSASATPPIAAAPAASTPITTPATTSRRLRRRGGREAVETKRSDTPQDGSRDVRCGSRSYEACGVSGEPPDQHRPVLAGAVVVVDDPVDREAQRLVESDRAAVGRRGDAAHRRAAVLPDGLEEALVQAPADARATMLGSDADEVDVRLVRVRLGDEADQEGDEVSPFVLRHEARPLEVEEEELRQHRRHLTPAPPGVDMLDHTAVVGRVGMPDLEHRSEPTSPAREGARFAHPGNQRAVSTPTVRA